MKINPKRKSPEQSAGLRDMCRYLVELKLTRRLWTVVEIGSWMGESAVIFSGYFDRVICVDPFEGKASDVYPIFAKAIKSHPRIEHLCERAGASRKYIGDPVTFVYIDAVHEYEPVKSDIEYWRYRAAAIGGHDYGGNFPGVKRAVDEAFGKPDAVFQDTSWVKVMR